MSAPKKRWAQIDKLYTIGITLVLIGHSHSSTWANFYRTPLHLAVLFIYTFHMPLFFFVAGVLFQNSTSLERKGYRKWIGEKALRLLTPYVFWTLLAMVPKLYLLEHSLAHLTPRFVLEGLFIPRGITWGHFWFIPVLFLTYVLFGASRAMARRAKDRRFMQAGGAVCACLALALYFSPIDWLFLALADLKKSLIFFTLGMAFRAYFPIDRLSAWIAPGGKWRSAAQGGVVPGLFVAAVIWLAAGELPVVSLLVAVLMLLVCWVLAELLPSTAISRQVGQNSFTVYIFSWFFQAAVMVLCDRMHFSWQLTFVCMFLAGTVGSAALLWLCARLPLMKKRFFRLVFGLR